MKKIVTIVGARPQFVKAAVVSRAFKEHGNVSESIIHTGQHFDANMSDIFFEEMHIPTPDYHLGIDSLSHGAMTGRMLEAIEIVLLDKRPDALLVYGDTNSTLAGALAAKKIHIPVVHVESGLRSYNMDMPEEINRILTDRISDWLFCPTQTAVDNLLKEGYASIDTKIELVGDVMYDAVEYYKPMALEKSTILRNNNIGKEQFVLATIHRQENTKNKKTLSAIIDSLKAISNECKVVWPIHPRTAKLIKKLNIDTGGVQLIDPVGYFDMLALLDGCKLVITDSGGLQKEAYFFKKYCITVRDQTEWIELVQAGCNELTSAETSSIMESWNRSKTKQIDTSSHLYGNGNAGQLIVKHLC